jgi:CHASE3 domain sensor protein
MKWSVERTNTAGFSAALIILVVIRIASYQSIPGSVASGDLVQHTHLVLEKLQSLLSLMQDVETGQRGYAITGKDEFLEPCAAALPQVETTVAELRQLTADNPRQQARLDRLEPLNAPWPAVLGRSSGRSIR